MRKYDKHDNIQKEEKKIEYTYTFKVHETIELLEFLLKRLNTSRNNVKMLLSNNQVLVNGAVMRQFNLLLSNEDEVRIAKKPVLTGKPNNKKIEKKEPKIKLDIIYQDDDFIAISKPFGLLAVESDKDVKSAYSYMVEYLQGINKTLRPYIIHRIDKETSGILVFALNPKIQSQMRLKWNDLVKTREYYAIVLGKMEKKEDTIISYLYEDNVNLVHVGKGPNSKKAVTKYRVIKESNEYSLLKVEIETGRKNQIRVVMESLGHPIIGDTKYGKIPSPIKRLGLHASRLVFLNPFSGEEIAINDKCPSSFNTLFDKK